MSSLYAKCQDVEGIDPPPVQMCCVEFVVLVPSSLLASQESVRQLEEILGG